MSAGHSSLRETVVARERIHLFFATRTIPYLGGIRVLQALNTIGAFYTGLLVWLLCDLPILRVILWTGLVFGTECLITKINDLFHAASPPDDALWRWGWAKAVLCGLNALTWSLGPLFLHVPAAPASVLVPVSGLIYFVTIATWIVGADYTPSIWLVTPAAIFPGALWLLSFGSGLEQVSGIGLISLLPFTGAAGIIAAGKSKAAIKIRLEIAELLDIKAKQAQQIEELFAERTRFFSAASHDLRQPLNAMGLYFELLARSPDAREQNEIIEHLQGCAASLLRQFDAIMGLSATDSEIRSAKIRPVPVQDVLVKVGSTLRLEAQLKALQLRVSPSSLWCLVDATLLERALLNLVSNSIKYTKRGSILIGARRQGENVKIQVIDTGIGINQKYLDTIFDDFFQVDNPERNREKGLGIGLAIVRRLGEAMDWQISVRSVPGRGTAFSLAVPMADEIRSNDIVEPSKSDQNTANLTDQPGVMVIDDDAMTRDSLGRLLKSWGYECVLFEAGAPAVRFLEQECEQKRWNILLDYRLAGKETGLMIADEILATHSDRTRISLMTGDIGSEIAEGARQRGLLLMSKPVQPIRLNALLSSEFAVKQVTGVRSAIS
jgi:signal transduction histidine kinase/ActR/RegA family two-component response regulator